MSEFENTPLETASETTVPETASEAAPRDKHTWYPLDRNIGRYKGEWRNNKPHGIGVKEYYNDDSELGRSTVHGKFVDGRIEGFGIQVFEQTHEPSIPYYIGTFKNSEHDGFGEYHFGTGSFYKGEFKMGKFHGRGMFYSKANDDTFVGEYADDREVSGMRFKGRVA